MKQKDIFDFELNEAEGYWSVTRYYGKSEEIIFPASYKDMPVRAIGGFFTSNKKRIKHIVIPEGFTSIGKRAFHDFTGLTTILLPKSFSSIGDFAFNGCTGLTAIIVDENNSAFCSLDGVLFDKEKRELIEYPKNKKNTDYAVPDGIICIRHHSFCGCKHLVNIVLPKSLEIIDDYAFMGCKRLKTITLPKSLQYIGEGTAKNLPNLETIMLSKKTRIGYKAFEGYKGKFIL